MDKDARKIGLAVRAARAATGIGQMELARRVGVSQSTIARLERFRGSISGGPFLRLITIFQDHGVKIDCPVDGPITVTINADEINNMESTK